MSRKKAVAGGVGVLSAALVAGAVLAPAAGAAEAKNSGVDSAFAISASGLLKVDPTPSVDSSEGFAQQSLAELKLPPALLDLRLLTAKAGAGQARAAVADVSVGLGVGKPLLSASAIEASCHHGKVSSSLAKAKIGDVNLAVQVPPNTGVSVPGLLSVVLNKQTTHPDGSVTVTAISINVDGIQKLDLASATCVPGDGDDGSTSTKPTSSTKTSSRTSAPASSSAAGGGGGAGPAGDRALPNGKAPAPTPVKAHLDVTG